MVLFLVLVLVYFNIILNGVWCEEDIFKVIIIVLDILYIVFGN